MKNTKISKGCLLCVAMLLLFGVSEGFAAGGKVDVEEREEEGLQGIEFPDRFPTVPKRVDPSLYSYDDMSKKYDFEIMSYGYAVQPLPKDPIRDYLQEKFNCTFKFTDVPTNDLSSMITVRFASGNPPDFIHTIDKNTVLTLFEQGQLMEVSGILKYVPQASQYITKTYKDWATVDGKIIGIPRYPVFPNNYGFFIRSDWLEELGLDKPTNEDEIFEYAKAVTFNDVNKNGKADTWFMGSGAGGHGFGQMVQFKSMYGHPNWNVKDGKINHPVLDNTTRDFLAFIKKLYDAKVLLPDWFTIPGENYKSYTMNDQIGMIHYPGWNLIQETYDAHRMDMASTKVWEPIDPPKAMDGRGGKYIPGRGPGGFFIIPKKMENEMSKLKRILHMFDTLIYPNENYWAVLRGGPEVFPGFSRVVFNEKDGTNVYEMYRDKHPVWVDPTLSTLSNYYTWAYTLIWEVYDDPMGLVGSKWNQYVIKLPRYKNWDIFLTLDAKTNVKIGEFERKNEIAFVLGERSLTDWDKYIDEWKKAGGQALMDQAAQQLGVSTQ